MLKLQRRDGQHEPVQIVDKLYSIGSADSNNLILSEPCIDSIHARIICTDDTATVKDNTSSTGCFVNGQRVTQKTITPGDNLQIGSIEFDVLDFDCPLSGTDNEWQLVADGHWLAGQSFTITPEHPFTIGRAKECDITIAGSHLSRRHTQVTIVGGSLRVRDLQSANGTFINDELVKDVMVHGGDRLRIDVYSFRVVSPEQLHHPKPQSRKRTTPLTHTVKRKTPSSGPKRWITRPTSPGNRAEPSDQQPSVFWPLLGVSVLAAILLAIVISY